jgi:hypothetical protein
MMSTISVIPLINMAQLFSITLASVVYNCRCYWNNDPAGGWCLDISDANSIPIVMGIPLVTGADLLAQYGYLNFGGQLRVATKGSPLAVPTYSNLGDASNLYFITTP